MTLDEDKIDDAVLALLRLGLHDGYHVWKGFDWDALDRLHQKGYISAPKTTQKSVALSAGGDAKSLELLQRLFGKQA